ncbi:cytidine deaminase [Candidatus Bathyarchaeota archaeon]|jgi:cytidine deaminase|nr:cytidine deaminase [Candidatus Bathyarchaeota archaeon]
MNKLDPKVSEALILSARNGAARAVNPLTGINVGAAVLTSNEDVFIGFNIESASSAGILCAERVAIVNALLSDSAARILALAVTVPGATLKSQKMSCGTCRQFMSGILAPEAWIIVDTVGHFRLEELIPDPYRRKQ